jgi:hypothetical protein
LPADALSGGAMRKSERAAISGRASQDFRPKSQPREHRAVLAAARPMHSPATCAGNPARAVVRVVDPASGD